MWGLDEDWPRVCSIAAERHDARPGLPHVWSANGELSTMSIPGMDGADRRNTWLIVWSWLMVVSVPASAVRAQEPTADAFFDDGSLQEIQLRINSADWQKLQETFQDNTYYPCDLVWQGQTVRNVGIRSRGTGSRNQLKPGLRVDFDRYATEQEFLGLKSFVLDNLTQDPSGLRERVTMKLFAKLGLPAPREAHARLFVNGQYGGLYAIVESIDKRFLRRYEGLDADGFLFEYDWIDVWQFAYRGPELEAYQAVFPAQTHEKDAISTLYDPIETFVRIANTASDVATDLAPYLDALPFLKFLAAERYVAEWDGLTGYAGMNNFYLYRTPSRTEFKFIAWDRDNAFYSVDYSVFQGIGENVLTRRLLEIAEYRAYYVDMVLEAASAADAPEGEAVEGQVPPTWLQAEIERQYAQVREAMLADANKPFTNDEFEAAIETLRAFARDRSAFVRSELQPAQP
jgi:hypothetical protein